MVEITFTIEGEEHSVEVDPAVGHPGEVYRSGEKVADHVSELGYEFADDPPEYQELSRAHRKSGNAEVVPLGDITGRVRATSDASGPTPGTGPKDGGEPAGDEVKLELVGPDGHAIDRPFRRNLKLAQVKADLVSYHGIDRNKAVDLYESTDKMNPLENSRPVTDFEDDTLYWDPAER